MRRPRVNAFPLGPAALFAAALAIVGLSLSSPTLAAVPSFSGSYNQMYTTSTTDSGGNTTYSLDFHMTGSGIPINLNALPSGLNGAVTEDLMVSYGPSGTPNGSGGPVVMSELVISTGTNQATYDISGETLTQYGTVNNPASWVGIISGGIATLNTSPTKTTPTFATDLTTLPVGNFTMSYVGAYMNSSSSPPILASAGSASYAVVAVPEPASFMTFGVGAVAIVGYLARKRRSRSESLQPAIGFAGG